MIPPLTTPVSVPSLPFRLSEQSVVLSLGSCFADEVGQRLAESGIRVELNPFGTLYNPASIASALRRLMDCTPLSEADLVQHEGRWHSWHHHGSFSRPTAAECLEVCNLRMSLASQLLSEANLLMITFGTAWVFELNQTDAERPRIGVVANCHKLPAEAFIHRRMPIEEITSLWNPLLEELHNRFPSLHVLFTVSPIRHLADGAHGNQLSKSTLLLALDQLLSAPERAAHCSYFPAYEIALDELRDYRFYAADLKHLSPTAVDIIYDRFEQACMTASTAAQAHLHRKRTRGNQHRPLHP